MGHKNKGVARIPIDRAMELTVAELAQKKPAPAGPIATPAVQNTTHRSVACSACCATRSNGLSSAAAAASPSPAPARTP